MNILTENKTCLFEKDFFYQKSIWLESIQMCITDWGDAADGADNMQTNGRKATRLKRAVAEERGAK